jgi:uncharacterized membrane protein YgcG
VSLVEVVLAVAVLATTLSILTQYVSLATLAARQAAALALAQVHAQSVMSELAAAQIVPAAVAGAALPQDAQFQYSVDVQPTPTPGLLSVVVTVSEVATSRRAASFQLTRWMADPTYVSPAETAIATAAATAEADALLSTDSSAAGSGGSNGSGSGAPGGAGGGGAGGAGGGGAGGGAGGAGGGR